MSSRPKAAAQPLANHTPANESPPVSSCLHLCTFPLLHLCTSALTPPALLKLPEAELVGEGEAVFHGTKSFGGSGVLQASGGAADSEAKSLLDFEAFMQAIEHARGKRVASARRTLAVTDREFERGLLQAKAIGGRTHGAVFGVDRNGLLDAQGE